jgi:divalent metal cation (Fe/Co/Zn/Cd) transporter
LAWYTGWDYFDPICAFVLALHILFSGFKLMRQSINGLLDAADPEIDKTIADTLEKRKPNSKSISTAFATIDRRRLSYRIAPVIS